VPVATRIASPIGLACPADTRRSNRYQPCRFVRRGLARDAGLGRNGAALALVVVDVDHEREHESGVGERAARGPLEVGAHGARLDVDVESVPGVADRPVDHALDVVDEKAGRDQLVVDAVEP
jgi:hypothetical protein